MIDRQEIFERDEYICQNPHCCDYVGLIGKAPQLAHLIPDAKWTKSKYGTKVVNHPKNKKLVCSLECNNALQLNGKPAECDALAEEIRALLDQ